MNTRSEWIESSNTSFSKLFYTKEETISSVVENFNYRRYYSAEGCSVDIDGTVEQVIKQDHTNPINQSKTDKKLLVPMNSIVKSGSYVKFDNETWLVVSHVNVVDNAYKTCQIQRCNYTLLFQSPTGTIISTPCITSNKSFSNDESKVMVLGSNQKSISCAFNADTELLDTDDRLFVDKATNKTPYKIIGDVDTTTNDGLIYFIVEQCVTETDDRPDLGICNYFPPTITPPVPVGNTYSTVKVSGDLIINGRTRTLTGTPYKADGTVDTSVNLIWTFVKPVGFESIITTVPNGNICTINVGDTVDPNIIGKEVNVSVADSSGNYAGNLTIKIKM